MGNRVLWSAVNISEGRKVEALESLAVIVERGPAQLADWSRDIDHNRSVFSLVGTRPALTQAIEDMFAWAVTHIDLSDHRGVHPRLGALDVVPFVPLSKDCTLEDARQTAREIAQRVAEKFNIPLFLYRDSSSPENMITLPLLRRGGFEALLQRMQSGQLKPDFGPSLPHPALGVTAMGARTPLVAFNCLLDTEDLALGKEIARELRASQGGVPHLQALAFTLPSRGHRVQISMNLLHPAETPLHRAYLAVCEVSGQKGAEVLSSELIGLVPFQCMKDAVQHFLKLETLQDSQIAEWNLKPVDRMVYNETS